MWIPCLLSLGEPLLFLPLIDPSGERTPLSHCCPEIRGNTFDFPLFNIIVYGFLIYSLYMLGMVLSNSSEIVSSEIVVLCKAFFELSNNLLSVVSDPILYSFTLCFNGSLCNKYMRSLVFR